MSATDDPQTDGRVRLSFADLEPLTIADARPEDFIDPGEDQAFLPDVQDGECRA